MRRTIATALVALFLSPTAAVAAVKADLPWDKFHQKVIINNDLERNWAKTDGVMRPAALYYQEVRKTVVNHARKRWVLAHTPEPSVSPMVASSDSVTVTATVPWTMGHIQELICSYSWDCATALRVSSCESGFNPLADNPHSSAFGLFQRLGETSTDPKVQVANAYAMYVSRGWQPWGLGESWGCAF